LCKHGQRGESFVSFLLLFLESWVIFRSSNTCKRQESEEELSSLQELGFTREEIEQKVIEKIATDLMSEYVYETDTGASYPENSRLARRFHEVIKKQVDRQMERLAEEYIVPNVKSLIEGVAIKNTNVYGEEKGETQTFVEYLTAMAQNYLSQTVDFQGKPVERNSYNSNAQTRLIHLVNQHLHHAIECAMKDAADIVKQQLGKSLEETAKIKLAEIASSIKIQVTK
jgi:hypothetical protein